MPLAPSPGPSLPQWLIEVATLFGGIVAGAGGLWAALKVIAAAKSTEAVARIQAPAELLPAMAAFQEALNKQAESLVEDLRSEIAALKEEAAGLRERIVELEGDNLLCRGENRDMKQRVGSLESWLRRAGIEVPGGTASGSLITIEGDHVTVLKPGEGGQP